MQDALGSAPPALSLLPSCLNYKVFSGRTILVNCLYVGTIIMGL